MSVIKLLDNSLWAQDAILKEMMNDSFYYGFLSKAALSSSSAKLLLDSPRTYYNITKYASNEHTPALFLGRLIHHLALEPEKVPELYELATVKSRNAKAYKEQSEATKKDVVLQAEWDQCNKTVDALNRSDAWLELMDGCQVEIPAIGYLEGLPFRAKCDVRTNNGGIVDLKTTSDLSAFPYSAKKYSYDMQCYIYCNLFNVHYSDFKFAAVDKKSNDFAIYDVSESFYISGKEKLEEATTRYKEFFPNGIDAPDVTDKLDQYYIKGTL